MIVLEEVGKKYLNMQHSLKINKGDFVALIGKNGTGKSTLIKMICGLRKPDFGKITINGSIAYCPDNVTLPKEMNGYSYLLNLCRVRKVKFDDTLAIVFGIPFYSNVRTYSKGNVQKLAIISTLLSNKDIYVFDEPFNALDSYSKRRFVKYLRLYKSLGKTIIMTTHDLKYIRSLVDNIYEVH